MRLKIENVLVYFALVTLSINFGGPAGGDPTWRLETPLAIILSGLQRRLNLNEESILKQYCSDMGIVFILKGR